MAYFATSADFLSRSSGLITTGTTGVLGISFWARQRTLPAGSDYNTYHGYLNAVPASYTDWAAAFSNQTGTADDYYEVRSGAGTVTVTKAEKPANRWRHFFLIDNGITSVSALTQLYVDGYSAGTVVGNRRSLSAIVTEVVGGDSFSIGDLDVLFVREWLGNTWTATQVRREMLSMTPVRTANLYLDAPLVSDLLDDSGNGRDWTANGSVTFNADLPPYFEIPNSTQATASTISALSDFDATDTFPIDFPDFEPARLWLKYIPAATMWVSFWIRPESLVGDLLATGTELYDAAQSLTVSVLGSNVDDMPFFYRFVAGQTYYLEIRNNGSPLETAARNVLINAESLPEVASIPAGYLAINNDTTGMPTVVIDPSDGQVVAILSGTFANGEKGDTLVTGEVYLSNEHNVTREGKVYSAALVEIKTITYSGQIKDITSNAIRTFWYDMEANGKISKVLPDGTRTLIATHSFGSGGLGLAVAADETTAYILFVSGGVYVVKRWNLVTDSVMSDFFTPTAGFALLPDIMVLPDDTVILTTYNTSVSRHDFLMRRFDAAGTQVQTYDLDQADTWNINHYSYRPDGQLQVWLWNHANTSLSAFTVLNVTTGAVDPSDYTDTQAYQFFSGGSNESSNPTDPQRFGSGNSCTMWTQQLESAPPEEIDVPSDTGEGGSDTIPTCCDEGGPPGGGDTGVNPDPVGTLPPWMASCTGGGLVDGVADLADGESWL